MLPLIKKDLESTQTNKPGMRKMDHQNNFQKLLLLNFLKPDNQRESFLSLILDFIASRLNREACSARLTKQIIISNKINIKGVESHGVNIKLEDNISSYYF